MSTAVGATRQLTWGTTLQGKEIRGSYGSRDVLIITQDETIQGDDIIPRRQAELTSGDKRELERLDLAPDQWEDDASIMAARYNMDSADYFITEVTKSRPGKTLTVKYVMKKMETLMNNTQREGGKLCAELLNTKRKKNYTLFSWSPVFWTW